MTPDALAPAYVATLPVLTRDQVAAYLQLPSADAARKWAKRVGLVPLRLGRAVRYTRRDIDRAIGIGNHSRKVA